MTANPRKLMSRVRSKNSAEDIMHSHGFAQVQNQHYGSDGCGNIPGSFTNQQAADERRRYVKGYENARIMQSAYTAKRAKAYIPRTHTGFGGRDTSGDGFSGSLIGRKLG